MLSVIHRKRRLVAAGGPLAPQERPLPSRGALLTCSEQRSCGSEMVEPSVRKKAWRT